jgi:Cu+-exporting ATPase
MARRLQEREAPGDARHRLRSRRMKMAMVTDPVCGMRIDTDDAAATAEHEGKTYYFCSQACHDAFVADPVAYSPDAR